MKYLATLIMLLIVISGVSAQNAADAYRSGTVVLQEDGIFGAGIDWKQVFNIPVVQDEGSSVEPRKSIAVADDGSIFVANYDSYTIQKLDPSGRPVKTFGQEGSADGQFRNRPIVRGVLDNRYVFTSEHNGRLTFFDLNGQFVKTLTLDYMPLQCIPLRDGKIAIVGFVAWSEDKTRHVVVIKDIDTGKENIVGSKITTSVAYETISLKTNKGQISLATSANKGSGWMIARSSEGNLIINYSDDPTIETFSPDGQRLSQFKMAVERVKYPEKERAQYGVKLRDVVAKLGVSEQDLQKAIDSIKHPEFLPYSYNVIVDSDKNLLVFTYTDNEAGHQFQAYKISPAGQLIGKVDLVSDKYDLNLNPNVCAVQFAGGYIYAIVTPKDAPDGPVRLIRGKLVAK